LKELEKEEKVTSTFDSMLKSIPHLEYYYIFYEKLLTSDLPKNLSFRMPLVKNKFSPLDPGILFQMHSVTCANRLHDYTEFLKVVEGTRTSAGGYFLDTAFEY